MDCSSELALHQAGNDWGAISRSKFHNSLRPAAVFDKQFLQALAVELRLLITHKNVRRLRPAVQALHLRVTCKFIKPSWRMAYACMTSIYELSTLTQLQQLLQTCHLGLSFWLVGFMSSTAVPADGAWKAFLAAAGFIRRSMEPLRESGNIVDSVLDNSTDWNFT